jgi:hypothetical protein
VDDPRDASITSRQLRNGRSVDMISHKGLIYREVFYRLRNVELHVDLFDRAEMCDHMTLFWTGQFRSILESLYKTITDSSSKKLKSLRTTDRNWSVVIHSVGLLGLGTMYNMLRPILSPAIAKAVGTGKLQMILVGNFSASWETIFSDMIGPGFSADGVNVIEEDDLDPVDLDDFFDD